MFKLTDKKTEGLINENNDLREQLIPENKEYYEALLILVRTKSLFRDDRIYEETLTSILLDLIEAQTSGTDAKTYLGQDIYALADDIVIETPKETLKQKLKLGLIFLLIFWLCSLLPELLTALFMANHIFTISFACLFLNTLIMYGFIYLFFKLLSTNRYILKVINQHPFKLWLFCLIPSSLLIGCFVIIQLLARNIWVWQIKLF